MSAPLHDAALLHDQNLIGLEYGGEAVRDDDRGAPRERALQSLLNGRLGGRIQMCGGLIQHHQVGRLQQQPRDRQALLLATGETIASLADHGIEAVGQRVHQLEDLRIAQRRADLFVRGVRLRIVEVGTDGVVEQVCILSDYADAIAQGLQSGVADIDAVDANRADWTSYSRGMS